MALRSTAYGYTDGGGGHLWVYVNWALGLRAAGCRVLWVELVDPADPEVERSLATLRDRLRPFGLDDAVVAVAPAGGPVRGGALDESVLDEADLLVDPAYDTPGRVIERCGHSALIDIDPGQLQCWWADGHIVPAPHDVYFTIGENIGTPGSRTPTCGVEWHYTPPAVALDEWPVTPPPPAGARFTTVTHWYAHEYFVHGDVWFDNAKRTAFLPYLDLPHAVDAELELAVALAGDEEERRLLEGHGWHIRESWSVARTPDAYREYIRGSRAEFSCSKPSTVHLGNAWISDRTLCYLASGRPAVVLDTGPSEVLPRDEGLLRFATPDEAAAAVRSVVEDPDRHARAARRLAEERFDARKVAAGVLERALP